MGLQFFSEMYLQVEQQHTILKGYFPQKKVGFEGCIISKRSKSQMIFIYRSLIFFITHNEVFKIDENLHGQRKERKSPLLRYVFVRISSHSWSMAALWLGWPLTCVVHLRWISSHSWRVWLATAKGLSTQLGAHRHHERVHDCTIRTPSRHTSTALEDLFLNNALHMHILVPPLSGLPTDRSRPESRRYSDPASTLGLWALVMRS